MAIGQLSQIPRGQEERGSFAYKLNLHTHLSKNKWSLCLDYSFLAGMVRRGPCLVSSVAVQAGPWAPRKGPGDPAHEIMYLPLKRNLRQNELKLFLLLLLQTTTDDGLAYLLELLKFLETPSENRVKPGSD